MPVSPYPAIIQTLIDSLPAILIMVDRQQRILDIYMTKRQLRHLKGKNFLKVIAGLFNAEMAQLIDDNYRQCIDLHEPREIKQFTYEAANGISEYANCRFFYFPANHSVAILIRNTTENVLIEQEFQALTEQAEATQRELCVALSTMDFRLMDLDQARKKLQALYHITSVGQKTVTEEEVLNEIIHTVMDEFGCPNVAILLLDEARNVLVMRAQHGYCNNDIVIGLDQGIVGYAVTQREVVHIPDVAADPRYIPGTVNCVSELAIPLIVSNQIIGVLDIENPAECAMSPYDIDLLRSIAAQAALTIAHARHVALVERVAITDSLTGLYNYHHFRTLLEQEYRRAYRYHHPLSMLMLDIDCFKHYNDTYGHIKGNYVLQAIARLIKQACRDVDLLFRYGGEEFAVLLPETGLAEAYVIGERIRTAIESYPFLGNEAGAHAHLTISIGAAAYPVDAASDTELVEQADSALYIAKRSSKNCVCIYSKEQATVMQHERQSV